MQHWKTLGFLGLLPFVICIYLSNDKAFFGISALHAFIAYSAIILSFIAGTVWKTDLHIDDNKKYIVSNIFSLIAFVSLLIEHDIALIILGLSFMLLFLYEMSLGKQKNLPTDYMSMRFWLTLIVVVLHIIGYFIWFS